MEALILLCFAWLAMTLSEFAYWSLIGLVRWAPHFAVGAIAGWITHLSGATELQALAIGFGTSLVSRRVWRSRPSP